MPSPTLLGRPLRLLAIGLLASFAAAQPAFAEDDFLDPELAFKLSASAADARNVVVDFAIAPGYYLYREQFKFAAAGAALGTPSIPPGKTKFDETFQKNVETYRDAVRISVPITDSPGTFRFLVTNQGCADKGLCYPPQQRGFELRMVSGGAASVRLLSADEVSTASSAITTTADAAITSASASTALGSAAATSAAPTGAAGPSGGLDGALRSGRWWPVVGVFFLAGVLLSLTPCVLPMLPILSSIIVGEGANVSRGRGLSLATSYSLGMALIYTALGVAAGLAGEGLAAMLQNPWVLSAFALLLVLLAVSMFGVYELQLPSALTSRLTSASQRLPAGRLASVFAMGGLSALIVSPCVAAPLAGALVYLSQTRDVWLGGSALFSLALGMSVPLLLIGASAGALLPRAGAWMDEVKRFFGLLLLGVALWTVQSVLPAALTLAGWGVLALCAAVLIASARAPQRAGGAGLSPSLWRRCAGVVLAAVGLLQLAGAAAGGTDPLQPLARWPRGGSATSVAERAPAFTAVRSVADLDAALRDAHRPVMLDFYADWCVSCKEMERFTFTDPAVATAMHGALLLRADVTANNADDKALLKRFQLFGPPGTIFFDAAGQEIAAARLIGYQGAEAFIRTLRSAGL